MKLKAEIHLNIFQLFVNSVSGRAPFHDREIAPVLQRAVYEHLPETEPRQIKIEYCSDIDRMEISWTEDQYGLDPKWRTLGLHKRRTMTSVHQSLPKWVRMILIQIDKKELSLTPGE